MTINFGSLCRFGSVLRIVLATALAVSASVDGYAQVAHAGRNVNMASGTTLPDGDPWLQRQSELSVACSSRDSLACLAVGNDYRTVDVPGLTAGKVIGDAWLGTFFTINGGQTWTTTLLPGYPQDQTQTGVDSPVHGFEAAADPTVRAGTNGMLYVSGIAFNRAAVPGSIPPADRAIQPPRSGILGFLTRVFTGLLGRPLEGGRRGSSNPPQTSGSGVVFLARYIDDNNVDAASAQKIRYVDTIVIDNGGSQFIDKPFLAVDIPRAGAANCTIPARGNTPAQSFSGGMLHVVYAVFNKSISNTRLMYSQSSDCGQTWTLATMIDQGVKISQGATIALDPNTGAINVFWRLFSEKNRPDAIYFARSTDGGQKFSKPGIVAAFTAARPPFDQPTLPNADVPDYRAFRTNTHPTAITDQFGRTYVAFTQRGWGPGANPTVGQLGDARVVITSAVCDATCGAWPTPTPVDNHSGRGHQFMPALTLTSGQLALAWQDQRDSYGPKLMQNPNDGFGNYIADAMNLTPFHTGDVRLAFAMPGPNPAFTDLTPGPDQEPARPSTRVSRYLFGFKPGTNGAPPDIRQLDFNPSNYPLFIDGTAPMIGDFIDVAPTTPFFRTPLGGWVYNLGQPAPLTSVALPPQVITVWGDNRDVRPPANGDWTQYTPPTYSPPWATSSPACVVGQEGMRNQNPYAAMVTSGFGMAAAGIAKPVNEIQRAFVVTLENSTDTLRSFRIQIENQPPSPGKASFLQFPTSGINDPLTELMVNIPAHTTSSRSVFVTAPPSVPFTPITVRGSEIGGTLNSAVVLDSDSTNPPPDDPSLITAESYDPIVSSTIVRVLNPDFLNPDFLNPDFLNPDFLNPDFLNPDFLNPDFLNPDFLNPDFLNPDFLNPDFLNPDFLNATGAGDQVTSVEWTVTNTGNTTASYAFKPVLQITPEEADRFAFLLFVSRIYQTPFVENCRLTFRTHTQHLAVIPNPDFLNPDFLNPDFLNPDFLNPDFLNPDFLNSILNSPISSSAGNTTLTIAPQETLRVTMLVRHDGSFNGEVATSTTAATLQQAINTDDAPACTDGNPATTCAPTTFVPLTIAFEPFDAGLAGSAYTESVSAVGGQPPYSWSASGLPTGLAINPVTGAITGTPTVPGTFNVLVTVLDTSAPAPRSDVQQYDLFIDDPFAPIVVTNTNDSGAGSLRDAIVQANTTPASVIRFNIPGAGVQTITPLSPLPAITEPVDIDGRTQPGYFGQPLIALSGGSAGPAANGLTIVAGSSFVRGLAINGFSAAGIELSVVGGNTVEANYIGTDATGTVSVPNHDGIVIINPSANNIIGGAAAGAGNVISGNTFSGIWLNGGGNTGTVIERNIIGLNAAGAGFLGNGTDGIRTLNAGAQIYRNFISANGNGISFSNSSSTYSSAIEGNYIGTDITGMIDRGNVVGVAIGSSPGTVVGGTIAGAGNLISGNQTGVYIFAGSHQSIDGLYNAVVQGNTIGMNVDLSAALANDTGVRLNNSDNLIGGPGLAANVIAGNVFNGVAIHSPGTVRNRVLGNSIHSNGQLGIDLDLDGPTPNDAAPDADAGANDRQNFPTLSSANQSGGITTVAGTLVSAPNATFTAQFFWGAAGTCDPSGLGEGANFIGTRVVTTNASGVAPFIYSFTGIPDLSVLTATATDSTGNTSEFGPCVAATLVSSVVVINTSDSGPGSLRNAILTANTTVGVRETISFNIPGAGVHTITPSTPLPTITDPVDLNATTQTGYAGLPLIEINGSLAGPAASGLILTAGTSSIRGLIINRFAVDGIVVQTGDSNVIAANYVGTTADGTTRSGNGGNAITIVDSPNNIIGGLTGTTPGGSCTGDCNLLVADSTSSRSSVSIQGATATGNELLGNFMGIDVTGTIGLAGINDFAIDMSNANGTIVGNGSPAGRNIVGGNNTGIVVSAANVSVRGNYVGINSAGTAPTTHGFGGFNQINGGIVLSGGSNSIVEGNIVSGNEGTAIVFSGVGASGNVVRGNYIGLNAAGNAAIGNGGDGVQLFNAANNNTIGGTTAAARNIISASAGAGVSLLSDSGVTSNKVIGNYIGTDAAGTGALPNVAVGVVIDEASGNFIGGTLAGEGNLIANNGVGVVVMPGNAVNNRILGNSIRANIGAFTSGLAIDLGDDGATPNDALDADTGPNDVQNFPDLTLANPTLIRGHLDSAPSETFTIQFFSNATCDASGFGEGESFLGQLVISTDAAGVSPLFSFGPPAALPIGSFVTATATSASGNTSEFSACLAVNNADPALFVVTNTNDSGAGSLRQAITDAEAMPGPNTITFNIPGAGPHTISPQTFPLPPITNAGGPITIDGTTQPGYIGDPVIELDGNAVLVSTVPGLAISAGNSIVRGLMINRFPESGIALTVNGNNTVEGNWIGLAADGVTPRGNALAGVYASGASNNNVIGGTGAATRNVISGNNRGVWLLNGTTGNVVEGNYIGTTKVGSAAVANGIGVWIENGATANTIGGANPAARNVISGNSTSGIRIDGSSGPSSNTVLGNHIGIDPVGTIAVPNGLGIDVTNNAGSNTIGGPGAGLGNVISGNNGYGIRIAGGAVGNTVQGNFIGTNPAGTSAMANMSGGIQLYGDVDNIIGGVTAAERNVISGNGDDAGPVGAGIEIDGGSAGAAVRGNYIGTNAAGTAAIRNRLYGILVTSGMGLIGGDVAGAGNLISGHNDIIGAGIRILAGGNGTLAQGNYIGTNATGTAAIPNRFGIANTSADITIGGTDPAARNVISGNLANNILSGGAGSRLIAIGNYVGLTAAGTAILSSPATGIQIGASSNNQVIGNVVSGNAGGIRLAGATTSTVAANFIGTNAAGTAALGNGGGPGVSLDLSATLNTIGGTTAADRNIISGNNAGISIIGANSNTVSGNYIGLNSAGTAALANGNGINITTASSSNVIGGSTAGERNVISGNFGNGIQISGAGSSGNIIKGNYLGTNAAGTAAAGASQAGIYVMSGATSTVIGGTTAGEGNVISGNQYGVRIEADGATIQGNLIGTDATGTVAVGNEFNAVRLESGTTGALLGGASAAARNIISGNGYGAYIDGADHVVQGNYIGPNVTGESALGNACFALVMGGSNILVGGSTAAARNVISGTGLCQAVHLGGHSPSPNYLRGNYIGLSASGAPMGNAGVGVFVLDSSNFVIGGTVAGQGNVISNNAVGIETNTTDTLTIEGNFIGTDPSGTLAMGNIGNGITLLGGHDIFIGLPDGSSNIRNTISGNGGSGIEITHVSNVRIDRNRIGTIAAGGAALPNTGNGVSVTGNSSNIRIGGTISDDSNRIAFNGGVGVAVTANSGFVPSGVNVSFNEIFSNGGLGIDLGGAGVNPNDLGDGDTGPNGLQNFPVLSGPVAGTPGSVTVSLNSTANTAFTLRIFVNTACNAAAPNDHGEGEDIRLAQGIVTDAAGNFLTTLGMQLVSGQVLTATATGPSGTSEFSQCVIVP